MATAAETIGRPTRQRRRSGLSERRLAAAMVSPSLIVIALVAAYPIGYAIWLSLNQYSVIHPGLSRWVGLGNYRDALTSSEFWSAFKTTFLFTAISVVLVPWAVLTVGTAMMWKTIFDADLGFANQVLQALHLPGGHTVWLGQNG